MLSTAEGGTIISWKSDDFLVGDVYEHFAELYFIIPFTTSLVAENGDILYSKMEDDGLSEIIPTLWNTTYSIHSLFRNHQPTG